MEKVKLVNKKTKVVKEVEKTFASDYLATKQWTLYQKDEKRYEIPKYDFIKEKKESK